MIEIILHAGRSTIEVALYSLLPIMIVLMIIMKILEAYNILEKLGMWLTPITKQFGLPGLGAVALLQAVLISFIAPLPTMKLMEIRGVSNRYLSATLAGVLTVAPANATFPLMALGLPLFFTIISSIVGGIIASFSTYYFFGRRLSTAQHKAQIVGTVINERPSMLKLINLGGKEAISSIVEIIPMLMLSLVVVFGLQSFGIIDWFAKVISPFLNYIGIDEIFILPAFTKYFAGNTAFVGLLFESVKQSGFDTKVIWKGAGFLIHPLDLPGIAILSSGGSRLTNTLLPAVSGAVIGIIFRGLITILLT